MTKQISACRICSKADLSTVLDLGIQSLTGFFPPKDQPFVPKSPLELCICGSCGLVQLNHTYSLPDMYGDRYGYRSGLNSSMVIHLRSIVEQVNSLIILKANDIVLDIGSNDGTLLGFYDHSLKRYGIDPTSSKFSEYYAEGIVRSQNFFNKNTFFELSSNAKAKVVTSISMLYDLEEPVSFFRDVSEILEHDGIWITEQSYLYSMLKTLSYDTICHEHLEYYTLKNLDYLASQADLKIIDVSFNDLNGGSFRVVFAKKDSIYTPSYSVLTSFLHEDLFANNLHGILNSFAMMTKLHRESIIQYFEDAHSEGRNIYGLGASTKGNVLLQYCDVDQSRLKGIFEVNPDKYNHVTPGTHIPILNQANILDYDVDELFVIPWHFKSFFDKHLLSKRYKLVYPLPVLTS